MTILGGGKGGEQKRGCPKEWMKRDNGTGKLLAGRAVELQMFGPIPSSPTITKLNVA